MAENKYYGMYQGVVTDIRDTEKRGRIKVKCPSILGETESAWCNPCVPVAYDNGGDFCLPNKDETVWLMFIEGDVNKPVYLGGWWQKDKTPLGGGYNDPEKVRIINYADCSITMKNGVIDINIGAGTCDLRIEHSKVTVLGNLVVTGRVSASNI
jgi:phage-related baseplate assembly protein|nr:MAG TPA: baseplate protein [Caudoviricetes sp.]